MNVLEFPSVDFSERLTNLKIKTANPKKSRIKIVGSTPMPLVQEAEREASEDRPSSQLEGELIDGDAEPDDRSEHNDEQY